MEEQIKVRDNVVVKKTLTAFGIDIASEGNVYQVARIDDRSVELNGYNGVLTLDRHTFDEHFEKKVENKINVNNNKNEEKYVKFEPIDIYTERVDDEQETEDNHMTNMITEEMVQEILDNSEFIVDTLFDKCTLVSCKLPNGFVITESSACVDQANYNEEIGFEICMERITNKVWELEGYRLQNELYEAERDEDEDVCEECAECPERYSCDHFNYPY